MKAKPKKNGTVTMRVRIGDAELEVTGPADFVQKQITGFVEQTPVKKVVSNSGTSATTAAGSALSPGRSGKPISPAQFFKASNPRTDTDRTLIAAYFLEKYRNAENATAAEIRDLIREAKVPPPSNPSDSINKNIRKGLLMTAGNRENKMAFVLTSDGEAAVEEMQQKTAD